MNRPIFLEQIRFNSGQHNRALAGWLSMEFLRGLGQEGLAHGFEQAVLWNDTIYFNVAISTASKVFHGALTWISPPLWEMTASAAALS